MKTQMKLGLKRFIVISFVISSSFGCEENTEWTCKSGDCLAVEQVCDGVSHCPDGSDETAATCLKTVCAPFLFRCTYGACVSKQAQCNGILECADGSDEADGLCAPDERSSNDICSDQEFQCFSGTCISQEYACNGKADCPDKSDETPRACSANLCSAPFFQCGYGACIEASKKCDGTVDCHDSSDESSCEINNRQINRTVTSRSSCIAPSIKNSILVYENDESDVIKAGAEVPNHAQIKYNCAKHFYREGQYSSICYNGLWIPPTPPVCIRYCNGGILKSVTFNAFCSYDSVTVECEEMIRPRTEVKIYCSLKYNENERHRNTLLCGEDGEWDYPPTKCVPVCGEKLVESVPFLVNGLRTNIEKVPWHVAIYNSIGGQYEHTCGGTILNAKLVITAAHCFWDSSKNKFNSKRFYLVGAGKTLRNYYTAEPIAAQFSNISSIEVPDDFSGPNNNFKADIAILVLINSLKFNTYIAPICVKWKKLGAKSLFTATIGLIAGWGKDDSGAFSSELKVTNVSMSTYEMCRREVRPELVHSINEDMFCVLSKNKTNACQGDSGGGFVVKEEQEINRHYLWGIVSNGLPNSMYCSQYEFVNYVNIQFHEDFIRTVKIRNRPK